MDLSEYGIIAIVGLVACVALATADLALRTKETNIVYGSYCNLSWHKDESICAK